MEETKISLENLKQGDIFYSVFGFNITKYQYHSLYPLKGAGENLIRDYHIVINRTSENPERIYGKTLEQILKENLNSYEEAKQKVKQNLQNRLERFNEDY